MTIPTRAIFDEKDLSSFVSSKAYDEIVQFLKLANASIKGQMCPSMCYSTSNRIQPLVLLFKTKLQSVLDNTPPLDQPMRFGNKAFRSFMDKVANEAKAMHESFLPLSLVDKHLEELVTYFLESFGNTTRIDYGTGHETNFILWLYGLHKIGYLKQEDLPDTILCVFTAYMDLIRQVQLVYMLEPAGSHGVWGLDDYQCLAFYFGSSQLIGHEDSIPTSCITDTSAVESHAAECLYLSSIQFILSVKKGSPFAETSPMLYDMSGVPNWEKINGGMMKLYIGEVLKKLPVIQHMLFGTIIECTWTFTCPSHNAAMPHPVSSHPIFLNGPNFNLPGALAHAPWVDPEAVEHLKQ